MKIYIFAILLATVFVCAHSIDRSQIHYLQQGDGFDYYPTKYSRNERFHMFCYEGKPKYIIHLWQSVVLQIQCENDDFVRYDGGTPEEVENEYNQHRSSWSVNLFSWKRKHIKLDPFNQSCVGFYSDNHYRINLHVIRIDYWKVLLLIIGVVLFLSAKKLSQNNLFYYLSGVSAGVILSFLILIYFISRLLPRKPLMYGVAAAGWTVGVYILQLIWENIRVILSEYKIYVAYYAAATGVISFMVCYRWGPPENERTRNLIKWSLQFLGLLAIFFSSDFQEAAMGQIVVLLLVHNTPRSWWIKPKTLWKRRFPPKVKPLSSDEYYEQGVRETAKALDELRQYCSSPDCNQWKTALQLKDVKRFASFMEGNSHLSDEEVLEYETSFNPISVTDDEEDAYTDEEDY